MLRRNQSISRAGTLVDRASGSVGEAVHEEPLLLFSVLNGFWLANLMAFDGDVVHELAEEFLVLAEKQGATVPLMIGHRLMGTANLLKGDIAQSRTHFDQSIALYETIGSVMPCQRGLA